MCKQNKAIDKDTKRNRGLCMCKQNRASVWKFHPHWNGTDLRAVDKEVEEYEGRICDLGTVGEGLVGPEALASALRPGELGDDPENHEAWGAQEQGYRLCNQRLRRRRNTR